MLTLENQMEQLAYDDPKLQAAYLYSDALEAITSMLSRNLALGLQHDLYFLELAAPIAAFTTQYGDEANDPETEWQLDDNLFLQIKVTKMSENILNRIIADGIYDDDSASLAILNKVTQDLNDLIAQAFPIQEDKKPAFISAYENGSEKAILQDGATDDKLGYMLKSTGRTPRDVPKP